MSCIRTVLRRTVALQAPGARSSDGRGSFTRSIWEQARAEYGRIDRPTLLIYGDHDWSRDDERAANGHAIAGAELQVVKHGGHFLSLDAPEEIVNAVMAFAGNLTVVTS
jgi:pimeloyl-ACP methyl ester carboxylesterase